MIVGIVRKRLTLCSVPAKKSERIPQQKIWVCHASTCVASRIFMRSSKSKNVTQTALVAVSRRIKMNAFLLCEGRKVLESYSRCSTSLSESRLVLNAATLKHQIMLSFCIIYLKHEEFGDIISFHVF